MKKMFAMVCMCMFLLNIMAVTVDAATADLGCGGCQAKAEGEKAGCDKAKEGCQDKEKQDCPNKDACDKAGEQAPKE